MQIVFSQCLYPATAPPPAMGPATAVPPVLCLVDWPLQYYDFTGCSLGTFARACVCGSTNASRWGLSVIWSSNPSPTSNARPALIHPDPNTFPIAFLVPQGPHRHPSFAHRVLFNQRPEAAGYCNGCLCSGQCLCQR